MLSAFGPLQAGLYLGVDLGEAVEVMTDGVDLLFQLVVLAAFGLVRIGRTSVFAYGLFGGSGSSRGLGGLRQIARKVVAALGINSPIGAVSGGGLIVVKALAADCGGAGGGRSSGGSGLDPSRLSWRRTPSGLCSPPFSRWW